MDPTKSISHRQWNIVDSLDMECRVWCFSFCGWALKSGIITSVTNSDSTCIVKLCENLWIRTTFSSISLSGPHDSGQNLLCLSRLSLSIGEFCVVSFSVLKMSNSCKSTFFPEFVVGVCVGVTPSSLSFVFPFNPSISPQEVHPDFVERFSFCPLSSSSTMYYIYPGQLFCGEVPPHPLSLLLVSSKEDYLEALQQIRIDSRMVKLLIDVSPALLHWEKEVLRWYASVDDYCSTSSEFPSSVVTTEQLNAWPELLLHPRSFSSSPPSSVLHPSTTTRNTIRRCLQGRNDNQVGCMNVSSCLTTEQTSLRKENVKEDEEMNIKSEEKIFCLHPALPASPIGADAFKSNSLEIKNVRVRIITETSNGEMQAFSMSRLMELANQTQENESEDAAFSVNLASLQAATTNEDIKKEVITQNENSPSGYTLQIPTAPSTKNSPLNSEHPVSDSKTSSHCMEITSAFLRDLLADASVIKTCRDERMKIDNKLWKLHRSSPTPSPSLVNLRKKCFEDFDMEKSKCFSDENGDETCDVDSYVPTASTTAAVSPTSPHVSSLLLPPVSSAPTQSSSFLLPPVSRALGLAPPHTIGEFVDSLRLAATSNARRFNRYHKNTSMSVPLTASSKEVAMSSSQQHQMTSNDMVDDLASIMSRALKEDVNALEKPLLESTASIHLTHRVASVTFAPRNQEPLASNLSKSNKLGQFSISALIHGCSVDTKMEGQDDAESIVHSTSYLHSHNLSQQSRPNSKKSYMQLGMDRHSQNNSSNFEIDSKRLSSDATVSSRHAVSDIVSSLDPSGRSRRSKALAMASLAASSRGGRGGLASQSTTPRQQETRALRVMRRRVAAGQASEDSYRAMVEASTSNTHASAANRSSNDGYLSINESEEDEDTNDHSLWPSAGAEDDDDRPSSRRPNKFPRLANGSYPHSASASANADVPSSSQQFDDDSAPASGRHRGLPRFGPGSRGGRTQARSKKYVTGAGVRTNVPPILLDALRKRDDTIVRAYSAALKAGADENQAFVAACAVTGLPIWEVRKIVVDRRAEHQQQMNAMALLLLQQAAVAAANNTQQATVEGSQTFETSMTDHQNVNNAAALLVNNLQAAQSSNPSVAAALLSAAAAAQQQQQQQQQDGTSLLSSAPASAAAAAAAVTSSPHAALKLFQQKQQNQFRLQLAAAAAAALNSTASVAANLNNPTTAIAHQSNTITGLMQQFSSSAAHSVAAQEESRSSAPSAQLSTAADFPSAAATQQQTSQVQPVANASNANLMAMAAMLAPHLSAMQMRAAQGLRPTSTPGGSFPAASSSNPAAPLSSNSPSADSNLQSSSSNPQQLQQQQQQQQQMLLQHLMMVRSLQHQQQQQQQQQQQSISASTAPEHSSEMRSSEPQPSHQQTTHSLTVPTVTSLQTIVSQQQQQQIQQAHAIQQSNLQMQQQHSANQRMAALNAYLSMQMNTRTTPNPTNTTTPSNSLPSAAPLPLAPRSSNFPLPSSVNAPLQQPVLNAQPTLTSPPPPSSPATPLVSNLQNASPQRFQRTGAISEPSTLAPVPVQTPASPTPLNRVMPSSNPLALPAHLSPQQQQLIVQALRAQDHMLKQQKNLMTVMSNPGMLPQHVVHIQKQLILIQHQLQAINSTFTQSGINPQQQQQLFQHFQQQQQMLATMSQQQNNPPTNPLGAGHFPSNNAF